MNDAPVSVSQTTPSEQSSDVESADLRPRPEGAFAFASKGAAFFFTLPNFKEQGDGQQSDPSG
jgi:hypothetical protein